jgi:hypothetical protein
VQRAAILGPASREPACLPYAHHNGQPLPFLGLHAHPGVSSAQRWDDDGWAYLICAICSGYVNTVARALAMALAMNTSMEVGGRPAPLSMRQTHQARTLDCGASECKGLDGLIASVLTRGKRCSCYMRHMPGWWGWRPARARQWCRTTARGCPLQHVSERKILERRRTLAVDLRHGLP